LERLSTGKTELADTPKSARAITLRMALSTGPAIHGEE
jgi:hypothetical protein